VVRAQRETPSNVLGPITLGKWIRFIRFQRNETFPGAAQSG
jgi:hypothetical protein